MVIFDLTKYETFFALRSWIEEILKANPRTKIPLVIVGNKVDLKLERVIKEEESKELVAILENEKFISADTIKYIETSAKTGHNTDLAFETLGKLIVREYN